MKTYKVKNYKGNLVESLKRFSDLHKDMKIVEAAEDGKDLKIKAEESKKIEEASGKKVYVLVQADEPYVPEAVYTSIEAAKKDIKEKNSEDPEYPDEYTIFEFELDNLSFDNNKEIAKKIK